MHRKGSDMMPQNNNLKNNFEKMRRGLNAGGTKSGEAQRFSTNARTTQGRQILTYEQILELVTSNMGNQLLNDNNISIDSKTNVVKDKQYLRDKLRHIKDFIRTILDANKVAMRDTTQDELLNMLGEDIVGYSVLSHAFYDDAVTDIFCMSYNNIYVEKNGHNEEYPYHFPSAESYKIFVERLLRDAGGKELNKGENKIVDFDLYGDRYNVINDIVSPAGITMTIRKHSESHLRLPDMLAHDLMSQEFADLFGLLLEGESNLVYAGVTGSGKTTTLRALLDYYISKINKRILVCEDTRELFLENKHTVELVTVKGGKGSEKDTTAITLNDLIISALRMKPKYIVVGEVRGVEAETAVEAMATGHSTVFSMHAGNPIDVVNRLITKYLQAMPSLGVDVVERIIGSSLEFIAIQDDIPGIGRRCTSLTEVSFNYETGRVVLTPIVKFNFDTKDFDYINVISNERIEKLRRRGITQKQLDEYLYRLFDKKDDVQKQDTYKDEYYETYCSEEYEDEDEYDSDAFEDIEEEY